MRILSIGAEALLSTMRDQIARSGSPQQVQQVEAQTFRKLDTLETSWQGEKGGNVDVAA